jgi:hypothetical protein
MYDTTGVSKPYSYPEAHDAARKNDMPGYRDDIPEEGASVTRGNKQALLLCKESTMMEETPSVADLLDDFDRSKDVNPTWDHMVDIPPRPTIRGMAGRLGMANITTILDIGGM